MEDDRWGKQVVDPLYVNGLENGLELIGMNLITVMTKRSRRNFKMHPICVVHPLEVSL